MHHFSVTRKRKQFIIIIFIHFTSFFKEKGIKQSLYPMAMGEIIVV
jgi:hypothetical protein